MIMKSNPGLMVACDVIKFNGIVILNQCNV